MKLEKILLDEKKSDVSLTAYILDDSQEMLNGKPRPAVLICPGGAYMYCSDREAEPVALRFAAMGYHAFVLRYSTYKEGEPGFVDLEKPMPPKPDRIYPTQIREIAMAMKYIADKSEDWRVERGKIILCGFSAGAHNCALYATNWHRPIIQDYLACAEDVLRPAAVILGYTLSDFVFMRDKSSESEFAKIFFDASCMALLGTTEADQAGLESVSPAGLVSEKTPPMFLWATAEDNLVPVQHSIRMANALAEHRVPFELHIFENGGHGLALASQATAYAKTQVSAPAAQWIQMAESWLMTRFSLELKDHEDIPGGAH